MYLIKETQLRYQLVLKERKKNENSRRKVNPLIFYQMTEPLPLIRRVKKISVLIMHRQRNQRFVPQGERIRIPQTHISVSHNNISREKQYVDSENRERCYNKWETQNDKFEKKLISNDFGNFCSICDRLWFANDLKPITGYQVTVIESWINKNWKHIGKHYEEYKKMTSKICQISVCVQLVVNI